jgi:DNA-binding response OmpR family regulator
MANKSQIEIVVVDDEPDILELVEYLLQKDGYKTTGFLSTQNLKQFLDEESPSLLIMDRNLPDIEGSVFVATLRKLGYTIPVIFLSAKDMQNDIEEGFERGGDDYITKPFQPKELILRVNAILRRTGVLQTQNIIKYKELSLNKNDNSVTIGVDSIKLTQFEVDLLSYLISNSAKIIDRATLQNDIWGEKLEDENQNAINVAISRLKKKIDPLNKLSYFHSVWGVGYRFE